MTTDTEKAQMRAQRQLRKMGQFYLGCLTLALLLGAGYALFWISGSALSLALRPSDPQTILIYDPAAMVFKLAATVLVAALVAASAALELRKAPVPSLITIIAVIVIAPVVAYILCYKDFYAVKPATGSVRLYYLWPRPDPTISARTITDVRVERSNIRGPLGSYRNPYRLRITAGDESLTSEWCDSKAPPEQAREAILREK